jgi:hypothetical protein
MKKLFCVFLAFSLFAGNVSANGNESNVTDAQTADFSSGLGAKVRLMQLEYAIEKNILWGEKVIAAVKKKNATTDTSDLETLLAELKALLAEVNSTVPAAGDESAKHFVDMRHDANEITKEFRESVHEMLKEADIPGMKKGLGEIKSNKSKELAKEINRTRHEYNAEKLAEILKDANITDPELLEKVRNGTASTGEVKNALKDSLMNMSGKERKDACNSISEKNKKSKILVRSVADKVAYKELERAEDRLEKRLDDTERQNISEQVRERLENRTRFIEQRMDKIKNHSKETQDDSDEQEDGLEDVIDDMEKDPSTHQNGTNSTKHLNESIEDDKGDVNDVLEERGNKSGRPARQNSTSATKHLNESIGDDAEDDLKERGNTTLRTAPHQNDANQTKHPDENSQDDTETDGKDTKETDEPADSSEQKGKDTKDDKEGNRGKGKE